MSLILNFFIKIYVILKVKDDSIKTHMYYYPSLLFIKKKNEWKYNFTY